MEGIGPVLVLGLGVVVVARLGDVWSVALSYGGWGCVIWGLCPAIVAHCVVVVVGWQGVFDAGAVCGACILWGVLIGSVDGEPPLDGRFIVSMFGGMCSISVCWLGMALWGIHVRIYGVWRVHGVDVRVYLGIGTLSSWGSLGWMACLDHVGCSSSVGLGKNIDSINLGLISLKFGEIESQGMRLIFP